MNLRDIYKVMLVIELKQQMHRKEAEEALKPKNKLINEFKTRAKKNKIKKIIQNSCLHYETGLPVTSV